MGRLIEKGFDYIKKSRIGCYMGFDDDCKYPTCGGCTIKNMYLKLQEYEDKLADGRLIELPCKVGDIVYAYCDTFNQIAPYKIDMIQLYGHSSMSFCANFKDDGELIDDLDFDFSDIGKTVFFSQAEAEQKLAEREQGIAMF